MATGSEQQTVRISALARAKVLLHAATHPRSQVHGLLVGKFAAGKGGGGGGGGGGGPLLAVADAVPLFHSCPTKPLLDVALRLVDAHLGEGGKDSSSSSSSSPAIVGWYTANERDLAGGGGGGGGGTDGDLPGPVALRVVGNLASAMEGDLPRHAEPVAVLVRGGAMAELLAGGGGGGGAGGGRILSVLGRDDRRHWVRPYPAGRVEMEGEGVAEGAVREACLGGGGGGGGGGGPAAALLHDFEDHLAGGREGMGDTDWLSNPAAAALLG